MGRSIRDASDRMDVQPAMSANIFAASILANAMERKGGPVDDDWAAFAMVHLDVSAPVLRYYLAHGNSVLLANVIHVIHRARDMLLRVNLGMDFDSWFLLLELAKFDAEDTLPELQHEFCAMWNEIVLGARSSSYRLPYVIMLSGIRQIYITLHQGTDAAPTAFTASTYIFDPIFDIVSSYPLCTIQGHRHLDSVPHAEDQETAPSTDQETTPSADQETTPSVDQETTPSSAATPSTVTRHGVIQTTVPLSITPDLHPLTVPNSGHTDQHLGNVSDAQQSPIPMASLDIPTGGATKRISAISSATNSLPRSSPSGGNVHVPQQTEPTLIAPHSIIFTFPSTHLSQAKRSVVPVDTLPSSDPTTSTPGYIIPGLAPPPSASVTAESSAPPQAASISDSDTPTRTAHIRSPDHSQDPSVPSLVGHSHRPHTSHPSAPGTTTGTLESDEDSDSSEDHAISTQLEIDIAD